MIHFSTRASNVGQALASMLTRATKCTLLPVALFASVLTSGCGAAPDVGEPTAEAEEVESSQAALAANCGNFHPITTLIQWEFTSSIPQKLSKLIINARNLGGTPCSRAGTVEIRQNGTLVATETLAARDFKPGFTVTTKFLSKQYLPPVNVKVCYGAASTCLSRTINSPIGE